MPTRTDVQTKRDTAYRLRTKDAKRMHALAADLEQRAGTLALTIASLDQQRISLCIEAAILRREARSPFRDG